MSLTDEALDRFVSKIEKTESCWIWKGATNHKAAEHPRPYGQFWFDGKTRQAHRMSLLLFKGVEISDDLQACHTCDNTLCVNPDHLFVGSKTDNMRDCSNKGRYYLQQNPEKAPKIGKLKKEEVLRIRGELREIGSGAIANMFNISTNAARDVLNGKTWKGIA